jgi:hypothetical protein
MKSSTPTLSPKNTKPKPKIPSHIFKRNDFYYFRLTLPKMYWNSIGREIYLSLKTTYKKQALRLAQYLHEEVQKMLKDPKIFLPDIKQKLHLNLQIKLAEIAKDSPDLSPKTVASIFPGIEEDLPDVRFGDTNETIIFQLLNATEGINDKEALHELSIKAISNLVEANILNSNIAKELTENEKLDLTKLFIGYEVKYFQSLQKIFCPNNTYSILDEIELFEPNTQKNTLKKSPKISSVIAE